MDRGRGRGRATKKRATLPPSQSHHSSPALDSTSPSTPTAAHSHSGPASQRGAKARSSASAHPAPQVVLGLGPRTTSPLLDLVNPRITPRADRPGRSATFNSSFSFESPSTVGTIMAAGGPSARKRARTFEPSFDGTPDDEGHSKGGHSLRKRARIDYTQEQIDDHLTSAAAKSEAAAKSVITPSARGRKKKGTHDGSDQLELEDFNFTSSIPKRRRPEKSPAPTRAAAASSRRRKTNSNLKKSSTEISTYVDQPSGDEVQDTILVGVSMDGLQDSDDERSEISSFGESETRPSTSDGSDAGQAQAEPEPATPQPEVIPQIEQAVSLAPESELSIDKDLVPEPPIEKADIAPGDISLTLQPKEPDPPEQPHEAEEPVQEPTPDEKTGLPESTEQVSEKPAEQPPAGPEHVKNETEVKAEHEVQPDVESTPPKPNQDLVIQTSELPAISEPIVQPLDPIQSKTLALSPAPPAVDFKSTTVAAEPIRPRHLSKIPSRRALRALQRSAPPARLKSLEKIYKIPSPFGTEIRLTPYYDDEDVRHPGPYTEWVNPDKDKTDITPMPTPTPTPSPMEAIPRETTWDGHRPLKFGDFFKLYRQETKRRQVDGEPHISMLEYKKECARKFKAAQALAETGTSTPSLAESATKPARSFPKITAEQIHKRLLAPGASRSFEDTPQGSQAADSQQPTAAPSPTAAEEDEPQIDGDADGLVDSPEAEAPGRVKTGSPAKPVEVTKNPPRQYLFPKLRDPQEFTDSFEGWQKMEPAKLYSTVAAAVETLDVYQREYNELKKIVDDEETAKRRVANDKTIINWENRQKPDDPPLWRRHFDDAVKGPPTFEVRGARAPKPFTDDPVLEHQKEEDKIMAQAYGFKHNAHPTQVGRQNPEDQRWEMSENRLRERKKTEKAAELAEENVIEGKRMRKPRNFSDQSKEPSRAGTPTGVAPPALGRRPRRKLTAMNDDDVDDQDSAEAAEPAAEPHTRKRRGPRPKGHSSADPEEPVLDAPVDQVQTDDEDVQDKTRQKSVSTPARKRGRGFATQQPPTSVPIDFGESKAKRQRTAKNQPAPEITSSSFYSNPSVDSRPESRPSTASSAATDNTLEAAETAYSLRDKRKRNFLLENDPEPETRPRKRTRAAAPPRPDNAEPKKRGPKRKTTASHPAPAAQAPLLPPPPPLVIAPPAIPHPVGGLKAPTFFFNQGPPALAPAPGPFLHTFNASPSFTSGHLPPPAAPPVVKKPITKIKLTNNGSSSQASSRAATPANIAPNPNPKVPSKTSRSLKPVAPAEPGAKPTLKSAAAAEVEKPYAEMSKSEKMSWSMRRRWASGEMQGAVEKRRTTLANKKAEKASVPANGDPVAIAPGEAGSAATSATSAPGTPSGTPAPPVLMPTQAGPPTGQLALPVQPPAPQTLQQPQGLAPPQGLRGFAHPTTERPEDLNEWDYA
ncbi:hypothetical protein B0T25DRAFT_559798 [Lasiosphaeria hispida]|uniref:Uncharacterized protein n=1 Tax=Lasiosphaeria hispida TaxID=260671 RepID=A0AAJ0H7D4_9PEZI|nr:hypothetical protein B0T25DRAFT_559798 [Lasiosphaeria hispida]